MREILFRGRTEKGEWFEGSLYQYTIETPLKNEKHYKIQEFNHGYCDEELLEPCFMSGFDEEVIPETVGQFTGLTYNGKKIFEGDIVKDKNDKLFVVRYVSGGFDLCPINEYYSNDKVSFNTLGETQTANYVREDGEVIGNIYDNPELLGE